tara:strand:- start:352 stop:609 length:258 start_codon:yes stop_codon:yes gene_type:complete
MQEHATPICNTPEEAFEAEMGFPISKASQSDYNTAEDNLFSAVNELMCTQCELDALSKAGFNELANNLRMLRVANMAMDCAREHL